MRCNRRGNLSAMARPNWIERADSCRAAPGVVREQANEGKPDMNAAQTFRELTETMRPQDPRGDGTGLRFETGEHGGDYPDNMPQAITVTDTQGRWAVYVPLLVGGKIVVPEPPAHCG
jgi:hypothetical protein